MTGRICLYLLICYRDNKSSFSYVRTTRKIRATASGRRHGSTRVEKTKAVRVVASMDPRAFPRRATLLKSDFKLIRALRNDIGSKETTFGPPMPHGFAGGPGQDTSLPPLQRQASPHGPKTNTILGFTKGNPPKVIPSDSTK